MAYGFNFSKVVSILTKHMKLLPLLLYLHLEKRRGENLYICKLLLTLQKIR